MLSREAAQMLEEIIHEQCACDYCKHREDCVERDAEGDVAGCVYFKVDGAIVE